jgi:toxin ParE1/3/4
VSRRIFRQRPALIDLDEAADYLRQEGGPHLAVRFLREVDATLQSLAAIPGIGACYKPHDPLFEDVRIFPVSRFKKYLVFYRSIKDGIEVLRVLHGARDIQGLLAEGFEISFDGDDLPDEAPDAT